MNLKLLNKFILLISISIVLLDLIIILIFYNELPEKIVSHYNGDLEPTDYSSKDFIFVLWAIHLMVILLLNVLFFVSKKIFQSILSYLVILIYSQFFMTIFDTIKTVLFEVYSFNNKSIFNYIEYTILAITFFVLIQQKLKELKLKKKSLQ